MKKLNDNWFIEGLIDFEYQQYVLLDYLQFVRKFYSEFKLYPCLSDLISQRKNLIKFQEDKLHIFNSFPKRLTGINTEELQLTYENTHSDSLSLVSEIIDFALPQIEKHIQIGKLMYDSMEKQITLQPIGIQSISKKDGYILIHGDSFIKVYKFCISPLEFNDEKFMGINFTSLAEYEVTADKASEKMKYKIMEKNREIPNSTSYFVELRKEFSNILEESVLPILKRKLLIIN